MSIRRKRLSYRNYAILTIIFIQAGIAKANITDFSGDMMAIGFGASQNKLSPRLEAANGNTVRFEPNVDSFTKLAFEYDWFAVSFKVNESDSDQTIYGNTDFEDFQFRIYHSPFIIDLFYQSYRSFYIDNSNEVLSTTLPFIVENLESKKYSLAVTYTFNPDFSLNHPYANDKIQTKSGGSWLLQLSYNHNQLDNGSSPIIPSASGVNYQSLQNLTAAKFDSIAFGPGYSYNLILYKFFVNATLILAPSIKSKEFDFVSSKEEDNELDAVNGAIKFGFGWNSKTWKLHAELNADTSTSQLEDESKVELTTLNTNFMLHYRYFF